MPGLIHNFVLMLLRHEVMPNPMKIALEKGFVFRTKPTDKHVKKFNVSLHEFQDWSVFHYGDPKDGEPILYFCHGGGFVAGMFKSYYDAIGPLYKALGHPIVVPDYPMPGEVDAMTMRNWVLNHFKFVRAEYPNSKIIVAGDSAGANMALALAQDLKAKAPEMIDTLYSLYGWLDLTRQEEDFPDNKEEVLLRGDLTPDAAARFHADIPAADPRISPLFGDLGQLPPMRIITAAKDMLYAESIELDRRLTELGAGHSYKCYDKYAHDFWLLPTPDGRRGLKEMAAMMREDFASF